MNPYLVFNCHEAWVHQLGILGCELDIIVGLKGHHASDWDTRMRPLPASSRTVALPEILSRKKPYDCIICHNITDLLDVKFLPGPRMLVLHASLDGRVHEEGADLPPEKFRDLVVHYLGLVGGHAVAVSSSKARSWGISDDIVSSGVDPQDYLSYKGSQAKGLRICNEISKRKKILWWDFQLKAFEDVPVRLVGHNPDMPGVEPAEDWSDLKRILSSHRFYIHTADPRFEDGYNMAALEAMAAGMPVLGNRHPTSPVEHGVSGFLSDDPDELRSYAKRLLDDQGLAARMGEKARRRVAQWFSLSKFKKRFTHSIQLARRKWETRVTGPGNVDY